MSYKVVYFSRSGNSERVAKKIGEKLSCEVIRLTDDKNWNGAFGYMKAGFYSMRNKDVNIELNGNLNKDDEIILVTPMWAGGVACAVGTFLKNFDIDKIHLVVTAKASDSNSIKDKSQFKSVTDIIEKKKNEDLVIEEFMKSII